jgi:hypothetical protein
MVAALLLAAAIGAHPLHTTLAEVTIDRAHATLRVVVRVFADDFGTAVNAAKSTATFDARAAAYVGRAITVVDAKKEHVATHDCGTRKQGDLLWLCAEATLTGDQLRHLTLRDQMLSELFADQVNVVRVTDGAVTRSMLFTRGDGGKAILD